MGANGLTPAYFIASEGTIASLNLAYTLPVTNMGKLKAIKFYNDYSYLDKNVMIGQTRKWTLQEWCLLLHHLWFGQIIPGEKL